MRAERLQIIWNCRCRVIEISFNYFLLGGETLAGWQGRYSDHPIGDEVPPCLRVTLNLTAVVLGSNGAGRC